MTTTIQFLLKTLWLMIMYYQTKFGSKRISSSQYIVETVIFWSYEPLLWPWPWKKQSNLSAWHSGSCWCLIIPSLVTKCLAVQKLSSGQTTFWPFTVTLTLDAVILFFSQHTLAYDDVSLDQVWLPKNQQFRRYSRKSHILIIWALTDLDLENIKQFFSRMTLWLMVLHHNAKFGNKMFFGSEDINRTNFQWHFESLLWPWPLTQ